MGDVPTGRRIKAARELLGVTVPELAARLDLPGLGDKTLGNIERGQRELRAHEVAPLARALEVPASWLVGEDNPAGEERLARMEAQLAAHAQTVERLLRDQERRLEDHDGLLREQSGLIHDMRFMLDEIRAAVASDNRLRDEIEAATRRLLEVAAAVATRALEAEVPSPAEAPDTSAK
jgi:transcriptional regulator with XRE-family HTH domain